ncbi:sulfatase [Paraurantiacibacter namhicola]|nr:sulfatase [Paraurantiacibacter namhicola]
MKTAIRLAMSASAIGLAAFGIAACTQDAGNAVASAPPPAEGSQWLVGLPDAAPERPNVLFIQIDDLRPDLGIYGHPTAQTPNMDALGRSGMVFDNGIVSQAVCGPSRAALMTGLRPDTTGITDLKTPVDEAVPNAVTMLDMFKGAGYETLGIGKIYHHADDDADGWTVREEDYEHILRRADRKAGIPRKAYDRAENRAELPDTLNVDMALDHMERLGDSGEPFFMAVGIHRPHLPFISPESDWARYSPSTVPEPVNRNGQEGAPPWALVAYEVWNYPETEDEKPNMPEPVADELRWGYLAAVSFADSLVGDLLRKLEAEGLADNTIIVLWGDHGWKLGDHAAWAKHSTADLDIRVPIIINAPGVTRQGTRTNTVVETVDIYPTLAQLAGFTPPSNLEGDSLVPLLLNPDRNWKEAGFSQYGRNAGLTEGNGKLMGRTVRTKRFRYTAWVDKSGKVAAQELYDLSVDSDESVNRAGDPKYGSDIARLERVRLGGWKAQRANLR